MRQVCEYCRTLVEPLRDNCKNCGAPVPKFYPEYNTYGSPHFAHLGLENAGWRPGLDSGQAVWSQETAAICGKLQHSKHVYKRGFR